MTSVVFMKLSVFTNRWGWFQLFYAIYPSSEPWPSQGFRGGSCLQVQKVIRPKFCECSGTRRKSLILAKGLMSTNMEPTNWNVPCGGWSDPGSAGQLPCWEGVTQFPAPSPCQNCKTGTASFCRRCWATSGSRRKNPYPKGHRPERKNMIGVVHLGRISGTH